MVDAALDAKEKKYQIDAAELFQYLDAIEKGGTATNRSEWQFGYNAAVEDVRDWLIADIGG